MKNPDAIDLEKILHDDLSEHDLRSIIDLVSHVSWWVDPIVYQSIQVVYPKTRRIKGREDRYQVIDGIKLWQNQPASNAFWLALGKTKDDFKNFYVCHIYEESAWHPDHFTNLANITAFPKSLQSLSEWKPIADVLKYHSYKIYGYKGPKNEIPTIPKYYPKSWRFVSNLCKGDIMKITEKLKDQASRRPMCKNKN